MRGAVIHIGHDSSMNTGSPTIQGWVLVVAREQRLRQLLLAVLGRVGYTLLSCATPGEAEQLTAQRSTLRLILFDGAEAGEAQLRAQIQQLAAVVHPEARCRIIVFSLAHPQPRLHMLPGADILIARPFDLAVVLDKVDALMQTA